MTAEARGKRSGPSAKVFAPYRSRLGPLLFWTQTRAASMTAEARGKRSGPSAKVFAPYRSRLGPLLFWTQTRAVASESNIGLHLSQIFYRCFGNIVYGFR